MANPVRRRLWGSEMSHEGAQNRGKDGGAHDSPHESSFDDGILYLSKDSLSADVRELADANSLQLVQDGGTISLLSGDGEDMSVDMYPYDQTLQSVGDNSAEWMKSKCKSLSIDFDGVGEENVGDILGLGSEPKVDSLMTMGGQFLGGGISEDSGIILCSDGVNLVASSISSGNDAKCSDIIPLCNMPDDLNSRTDQVLCHTSSSQSSSNSLLSASSVTVSGVFSEMPASLDAAGINFTAFTDKPSVQKFEPVEDLAQSAQTSILETNFPSLTASSQSLLGATASSVTSVASSVSDSGLTAILPNFLGIDSLTSPGNELNILNEGNTSGIAESLQQSVFLTSGDGSELANTVPANGDSTNIDLTDPSNVTLAMISVSTDKDANSTQIVVNTSQGQRLYMINTASLNQMPVSMVPVAQPVENAAAVQSITTLQPSASPNHFVLLPVVNGNITGGVMQASQSLDEDDAREMLVCPEPGCGKAFSKPSKLKIHAMQHTGERPFKCTRGGCDWAFTTAYKLKRHEESHEGNKDYYVSVCVLQCTRGGCDWAFTTAYKLKRHEESHEGKKDYYCDYEGCSRKFTTIYNLRSHQRLHGRPCTETCPEEGCGARFPTKRQLEAHLKKHNGEEKTFPCPFPGCSAVFYSAMSIGSHARMHKEREMDMRCQFDGCGKVFDRLCRLKQHVRQHTGEKPYVCTFEGCNWAFTTASKLKRHSAKHLNLRKFKCDQCDKRFMRPEHLKGHLITHTGVRPFRCPIEGCDASFTARSSLYVHLTKHDKDGGKMVFHCPVEGCSRKYSTKALLRTHILKHIMSGKSISDISGQEMAQLLIGGSADKDEPGRPSADEEGVGEEEEGEQLREDGVDISADQLTTAAVSQLLSSPVTISMESPLSTAQPTINLDSSQSRAVYLKNRSGCARTDFQSNHLISNQARQRWHQKREDTAQVTVPMETDTSPVQPVASADSMLGLVKQETDMYTAPESTVSGLTFRDPETGLTYVQTQLLQDDPPHAVYYSSDHLGLNSDTSDVGHTMLDMVPPHFPSTTINLNDLV